MPLDVSSLRTVPADLAAEYVAKGFWTDAGLGQLVESGLEVAAPETFTVRSAAHPYVGKIRDLDAAARSLAASLRARNVGPGDVIAFQLPNWAEAAVTFWAAAYLGAVVVPIVHFYGPKEVEYVLEVTRPAVLVTADEFGRADYLSSYEQLAAKHPETLWLVVSASSRPVPAGATQFTSLLDADPLATPARVDPDAPALVGFTSGTTRNPKGVVHSHRTIGFEARQLDMLGHSAPTLVGTPVGHFMGMLNAFLLPMLRTKPINLIDVWNPGEVLRSLVELDAVVGGGATYFLTSLLDHPDFTDAHLALIPKLGLGGAPVPPAVADRAAALGILLYRSYGSTEHPSVTGALYSEPEAKRLYTDGHALLGVDLRLDDEGQILTRGPDCFLGYTDAALTAAALDSDGWYHTGDVGVVDDDGYLTITDRLSDVIIRGGENISATELEDALLRLPAVAEVSVVSAPDERLGEHAAAVFRLHPGQAAPGLAAVREHLAAAGLSRQKWPESLYALEDFPRTASGKVQKFRLRDQLRDGVLEPSRIK